MRPIYVTKSYLPPLNEYETYLRRIWANHHLTNQGPLLTELESRLRAYLSLPLADFCSNGTIVLQMALKALGITGEVITTPFSYCATSHVVAWEGATPVFADIDPDTLCISAAAIEPLITDRTQAILATHVYGIPCEVDAIEAIARRHGLKVIYDGAHGFGVTTGGRSLLSYGDVSTCSFHATKAYHTVEGGLISAHDPELARQLRLYRSFGHVDADYLSIGINAKNSEFHAAMGLCVLDHFQEIVDSRHAVVEHYNAELDWSRLRRPDFSNQQQSNYAYYPVIFGDEARLLKAMAALNAEQIFPRRYFYPSLNQLKFLGPYQPCPVSEDLSTRVLCLPLFADLPAQDVQRICTVVNQNC